MGVFLSDVFSLPLRLIMRSILLLMMAMKIGESLKCYNHGEGLQWTDCNQKKGFRTCFTKFDIDGRTTARGCSTKDRIFHTECENHVMGQSSEKFCYCSYFLCNSDMRLKSQWTLLISSFMS